MPGRFERLREQDLRVASVAYRVSIANAAICGPALTPQLGFVLHGLEQYGPADRDAAARSYALGDQIGVMAVVAGSPAEQAGLVAGDQLVSVNGRALDVSAAGDVGRARVGRVQTVLVEEMRHGAVTLSVAGAGGVRELRIRAEAGCPSGAELIPGSELNAWADGGKVMISEGLLARCATDDELALVIGHEMAHNLLHHRQRLAAKGISANQLLPSGAQSTAMRGTEEEADRLAVRLATAARYDLSGAETFLGGLLDRGVALAATHPNSARRLMLLRAAIAGVVQRAGAAGTAPSIGNTASSDLVSGMM